MAGIQADTYSLYSYRKPNNGAVVLLSEKFEVVDFFHLFRLIGDATAI